MPVYFGQQRVKNNARSKGLSTKIPAARATGIFFYLRRCLAYFFISLDNGRLCFSAGLENGFMLRIKETLVAFLQDV
jgi:hypothetical protein